MATISRWALALSLLASGAYGAPLSTNEVSMADAPSWLTVSQVNNVVDRIQSLLEWDLRKSKVIWYSDEATFEKSHGLGPSVMAYSRKPENTMFMGPRVTKGNFGELFGHELVHMILYQKYKGAVPAWLEEGMANHLSHHGAVDYAWLAQQPPVDVRTVGHPFGGHGLDPRFAYATSTAVMEMIDSKCTLTDLLQLSVGKKFETYLVNTCEIKDVNAAYREWLKQKTR